MSRSRIVIVPIYWDFGHSTLLKWKIAITCAIKFLFHFRKFIAIHVSRALLTVIIVFVVCLFLFDPVHSILSKYFGF